MKRIINSFVKRIFGKHWHNQINNFKKLANEYDQLNSIKEWESSIKQEFVPWYTYPAIEYIRNFDLKNLSVLEYGAGASTIFFANSNAEVTAIENNKKWYEEFALKLTHDNIVVKFAENKEDYIYQDNAYSADVIIVDGSYRKSCCEFVINLIVNKQANPYWIIIDNSDWCPEILRNIDEKLSWQRVDFYGFGPINTYTWVTSIYLNPNKIINRKNYQLSSIGGIKNNDIFVS